MAKAGCERTADAEARRRGERTGLDTLVVRAVKEACGLAWDEKTLSADLKTALRGLYVLYGEEGYLVAR